MENKKINIIEFISKNPQYLNDFIKRFTVEGDITPLGSEEDLKKYVYDPFVSIIERKKRAQLVWRVRAGMSNNKEAFELMLNSIKNGEYFDDKLMKNINAIINKDISDTSGYRRSSVRLNREEYVPPEAWNIYSIMPQILDQYYKAPENSNKDIFYKAAEFHISFERLHPFEDGNGRTGRMILNYPLLQNNLPPVIIPNEEKIRYLRFLQQQDINGFAKYLEEKSELEKNIMFTYLDKKKEIERDER